MSKSKTKAPAPKRVLLYALLIFIAFVLALFTGAELTGQVNKNNLRGAVLAACSGSNLLFPNTGAASLERWIGDYRRETSLVVDDILATAENPTCTLEREDDVPQSLITLARKLAPWQKKNPTLSEAPSVLLEHLRVYECSLSEWNRFSFGSQVAGSSSSSVGTRIDTSFHRQAREQKLIQNELSIARPSLHRTLSYVGSALRLHPLSQNMDCLVRASADLRNVLGLAAETSMCLPRTWDVRQTLQNPAP